MSRNLSEGNPSKDAAATEYGVRQLFRRPAPVSPRLGQVPWIGFEDAGQTVPDNTSKFCVFTDVWYDPALVTGDVFDPSAGGDEHFYVESATQDGFDYWKVTTKKRGWYHFDFIGDYGDPDPSVASPAFAAIRITIPSGSYIFQLDQNVREARDWGDAGGDEEQGSSGYLNVSRTLYVPAGKQWGCTALQTSGADRDFAAHLKIWAYDDFGGDGSSTWANHTAPFVT